MRERLLRMGFTKEQIAVHTADEPDSSLLALANDETREVLVFKMAVALGFDAPRAFTLVSMRASRNPDFGVQLVGRILRVHRRLQGRAQAKTLPEPLSYGYVFLADAGDPDGPRHRRTKNQPDSNAIREGQHGHRCPALRRRVAGCRNSRKERAVALVPMGSRHRSRVETLRGRGRRRSGTAGVRSGFDKRWRTSST